MDALRYAAEIETDERFVDARWEQYDTMDAAINEAYTLNEEDWHYIEEYEYNIRQERNKYRINKAALDAERTNAELMVFIKQQFNAKDDITDSTAMMTKVQTKLDAATGDDLIKYADQITALQATIDAATMRDAELEAIVDDLTAKVTETAAVALTIEAKIADEETQIAIDYYHSELEYYEHEREIVES